MLRLATSVLLAALALAAPAAAQDQFPGAIPGRGLLWTRDACSAFACHRISLVETVVHLHAPNSAPYDDRPRHQAHAWYELYGTTTIRAAAVEQGYTAVETFLCAYNYDGSHYDGGCTNWLRAPAPTVGSVSTWTLRGDLFFQGEVATSPYFVYTDPADIRVGAAEIYPGEWAGAGVIVRGGWDDAYVPPHPSAAMSRSDLVFTPAPEPDTWALMGAGLLGLLVARIRRRA